MATVYPPNAITWLLGSQPQRVLVYGAPAGLLDMLAHHHVTLVDRDPDALARAAVSRLETPVTAVTVAASCDELPFTGGQFDVVLLPQNLHTLAPGLALPELARVLTDHGRLGVIYMTRDDTVPWVRRLAALLHPVDPTAMAGDYGTDSILQLEQSRFFPDLTTSSFRTWYPVTRQELVMMVERREQIAVLPEADRAALLRGVGALYDSMARAPEPLRLPYQASCWLARVNRDELSVPIPIQHDGLKIF